MRSWWPWTFAIFVVITTLTLFIHFLILMLLYVTILTYCLASSLCLMVYCSSLTHKIAKHEEASESFNVVSYIYDKRLKVDKLSMSWIDMMCDVKMPPHSITKALFYLPFLEPLHLLLFYIIETTMEAKFVCLLVMVGTHCF